MPYLLNEDGVIVEDLDGVSWTEVIKQQRALAASAARYEVLDESTEEWIEAAVVPEVKASNSELVRIEIGKEHDNLIASLSDRMDAMTQQQSEAMLAIVATLQQMGLRDPVFNVEAPNVTVEQPDITILPPEVTVEAAPAPNVTVEAAQAPNVTFSPEINLPAPPERKTVTFVRDYAGRLEGAEIAEE